MTTELLLERQDAVAIIAINDAPHNRMTLDFVDQLEELLQAERSIMGTVYLMPR